MLYFIMCSITVQRYYVFYYDDIIVFYYDGAKIRIIFDIYKQ